MVLHLRIDGDEAEALQRRADAEHRPVEEVAREAIRAHLQHGGSGDLLDEVARVRADDEFDGQLTALVEKDREILDRLVQRAG